MNWNATYEIIRNIRNEYVPYLLYCWDYNYSYVDKCNKIDCDDCLHKFYPATRDKSPQAFHSMYVYYHGDNPRVINLIKIYPGRRVL